LGIEFGTFVSIVDSYTILLSPLDPHTFIYSTKPINCCPFFYLFIFHKKI